MRGRRSLILSQIITNCYMSAGREIDGISAVFCTWISRMEKFGFSTTAQKKGVPIGLSRWECRSRTSFWRFMTPTCVSSWDLAPVKRWLIVQHKPSGRYPPPRLKFCAPACCVCEWRSPVLKTGWLAWSLMRSVIIYNAVCNTFFLICPHRRNPTLS
jgi:hypothetical protein